jgi:hemoglobin
MTSIFEQIGGAAAVDAAVDIFYRKVLGDPLISAFFDDVDMERQIRKQKSFLTMVFGGPNRYSGKGLRNAHKHMRIQEDHFRAVAGHLVATLQELQVPPELIDQVMAIAAGAHDDVLNV